MMTAAAGKDGIHLTFADGCSGIIPFKDLPEIGDLSSVKSLELPNPYELVVTDSRGATHEIPWDFARHYCDPAYRPRVEAVAERGRMSLGERVREMRRAAGMTQEQLASAAGIGPVTLVRLEKGEQSLRYDTLVAIARAMGRPVGKLLVAGYEAGLYSAAAPWPSSSSMSARACCRALTKGRSMKGTTVVEA